MAETVLPAAGDRIRTIFAGTPEFAVPCLHALARHRAVELIAVYTQPDRHAGRGRQLMASPVKKAAEALAVPIYQPENFRRPEDVAAFVDFRADVFAVAAYGLLLPASIINGAGLTCNVHASLLPRWRGAAPIQRAIMAGDQKTGITMIRIIEALDAGPMLSSRTLKIEADETTGSLHDKLAVLGAECLSALIDDICSERVVEVAQNDDDAIYAKKITAEDRWLDWSRSAIELERQIRALSPVPGSRANICDIDLKVHRAVVCKGANNSDPGQIVATGIDGIDIATGDGILRLTEIQPPGKKPMDAAAFVNGNRDLFG